MKFSANSVWESKDKYDVAVIGAGHAGCEAALACARLGFKTLVFTVSVDSIALMPCNPNIGGTSKGHLVREVDALGGEMGKVIDRTFIQSKMLNRSKGPAVHSLRAQADKACYSRTMRQVLENQENLEIKQTEVVNILTEDIETPGAEKKEKSYWCADLFRRNLSLSGSYSVYRNLSEVKMYLWRCKYEYRAKRTSGCQLSYGLLKRAWNQDV